MIIYRIFHCLIFISTEFYIKKKGEKKIFETLISVDISFSVKIFVLLEGNVRGTLVVRKRSNFSTLAMNFLRPSMRNTT